MNKPISVQLSKEERQALLDMAKQDYREPWNVVRLLIIDEAKRRGILAVDTPLKALNDANQ
jgi:hypothetical protein